MFDERRYERDARCLGRMGRAVLTWAVLTSAGCGDASKSEAGEGCTTDVECKGARICRSGQCVDPYAAGADGDGGGTSAGANGASGGDVIDDPELEAACGEDCKAKQAAGCTMNIGSLDQCLAQCLIIDEQSPYCLKELTARYACLADGGYACASDYPQPKATCITETQAYTQCMQKAPCRGYCARAAGECAPSGDACITACEAEQSSFEDAICGVYYSQLLTCWGRDLTCENGKPVAQSCEPAFAQVADCVGRRSDECAGFCWAAEELGCGSADCASECKLRLENTSCGSYYRNVLDCAFGSYSLKMSCESGKPTVSAECDTALQQYTNCMQPQ
jgi:hypothetical protein